MVQNRAPLKKADSGVTGVHICENLPCVKPGVRLQIHGLCGFSLSNLKEPSKHNRLQLLRHPHCASHPLVHLRHHLGAACLFPWLLHWFLTLKWAWVKQLTTKGPQVMSSFPWGNPCWGYLVVTHHTQWIHQIPYFGCQIARPTPTTSDEPCAWEAKMRASVWKSQRSPGRRGTTKPKLLGNCTHKEIRHMLLSPKKTCVYICIHRSLYYYGCLISSLIFLRSPHVHRVLTHASLSRTPSSRAMLPTFAPKARSLRLDVGLGEQQTSNFSSQVVGVQLNHKQKWEKWFPNNNHGYVVKTLNYYNNR